MRFSSIRCATLAQNYRQVAKYNIISLVVLYHCVELTWYTQKHTGRLGILCLAFTINRNPSLNSNRKEQNGETTPARLKRL